MLGATFSSDPRPSPPTSKTRHGFPSGSEGLGLRPAPLPTTRGLGLGVQGLVDCSERESARVVSAGQAARPRRVHPRSPV